MKLHLPIALLACVTAATAIASESVAHSQVVITPSTVDTVVSDVTYKGELPTGLISDKDLSKTPYVKDGQGTLTIEDTTTTTRASLSVREGTVIVKDSEITFNGNGSANGLNVGGTNASLQLEGSKVTNNYYMTVGGPDGKGALSLNNSELKVEGTLNVGTPSSWWWSTSCTNVGSTKVDKDSSKLYSGQYDNSLESTGYDRDFGTGTVTITGDSKLEVGTTLVMHNATLNVTGPDAEVTCNTRYNLDGTPFEDMGAGGGIMLGRTSGSTTKINVTDGGSFNALHVISGFNGATNTDTQITVNGSKSTFNVDGTMALGYGDEAQATSKATLTVTGGATLDAGALLLGEQASEYGTHKVDVMVGKGSSVSADELNISYGANMEVSGSLSVEELYMNAGKLTMTEGSTLNITLDAIPADGAIIDLGDEAIFNNLGSKIVLTLVGDALEALVNGSAEFVLIAGADDNDTVDVSKVTLTTTVAGAEIENAQITPNADGTVSVKASASIPEPTTATLSLLALAALAGRRRRK